jgi:toxin ParE1/3/4
MKIFRLTSQARIDLAEIRHYISQDKPLAADRQIETFFKRFHYLAENPELGELRTDLAENLRAFCVGNYVIFYRTASNGIDIIRVVSGHRNLERMF